MNLKRILTKKMTWITCALLTVVVTAYAFAMSKEKINYITESVKADYLQKTVNATGEVAAIELVSIGAQVSGQIEKLNVQLGQQVKKGELIAQIDSTTQQNELDTNKAKLKSYKAQLRSVNISLKVAKSQYDREKDLAEKNFTSKESLENAEKAYADAEAHALDLEALIEQAEIAVKTAEVNLTYTTIVAPFDGTIVSILVKEGQTVNANQYTPTIVQMADLSKMAILIQISEGDITKIRPGMEVTYSILSEPNAIYKAILTSIDPGLTFLTNGLYTGIIDANTPVYYYGRAIADNSAGKLYIGMTTQNEIIIDVREKALTVPTLAIYEKEGKKYVDVLEQGKPVTKEIVTGLTDSMYTEIISGLAEGESVINGQSKEGEITNPDIF